MASKVIDQSCDLYLNEKLSDVTIVVDNVELPAHRVILFQRCQYYKAMFESGMVEATSNRIEVRKTSVDSFKVVLKWIYTGETDLLSIDNAFEVIRLAHMYQIKQLVNEAVDCFIGGCKCTVENVCSIFNEAVSLSLEKLIDHLLCCFKANTCEILNHKSFETLSTEALNIMLTHVMLTAFDSEIFHAVVGWMKANPTSSADFPGVLKNVPMDHTVLDELECVPPDVMDPKVLEDLALEQLKHGPVYTLKNENVAVPWYGVQVIAGDTRSSFNAVTSKLEHTIRSSNEGIVIQLGRRFRLNCFKMKMFQTILHDCGYWIAVSEDNVTWTRVIDHTKCICFGMQTLYFEPRPVRFIHICGTADEVLEILEFEALYSTETFEIDRETTLIIPSDNVALAKKSALICQGHSYFKNALIDGTFKDYEKLAFTWHNLGTGIIVQLPQPYLLDSMKLLLWDKDDRVYSYNVEVSVDQVNWTRVFSEERVSSWREIHFNRQPVVFVKLTGTYNSRTGHFYCVHLECFAKDKKLIQKFE